MPADMARRRFGNRAAGRQSISRDRLRRPGLRPTSRSLTSRVFFASLVLSVVASVVAGCSNGAGIVGLAKDITDPRSGGRLYAPTSLFNQVVPVDPEIDPRSGDYLQLLERSKNEKGFVLSVEEWTVPAYFTEPGSTRHDVTISGQPPGAHYDPHFVHDVRRVMRGVPVPDTARPDPQEDAHMVVIDRASGCEYDFYGAARTPQGWMAKWASVTSTTGSGIYPRGLSTRATGFAPLAGMIWPAELRRGRIDHALVFAYPYTRAGGPVDPATASDGKTHLANALPQGARVQLDPTLDLDSLGLDRSERAIAEALQRYGMFLGDTGGALALYAVSPQSFKDNAYAGLLPAGPYVVLNKLPVDRFRVLTTGAQESYTPLSMDASRCASIEALD